MLLENAVSLLWKMVGTLLPAKHPKPGEGREVAATDLVRDQGNRPALSIRGTKEETTPLDGDSPLKRPKVSAVIKTKVQQNTTEQTTGQEWEVVPWKSTNLQTELRKRTQRKPGLCGLIG